MARLARIAAGYHHTVGITKGGRVVAAGNAKVGVADAARW